MAKPARPDPPFHLARLAPDHAARLRDLADLCAADLTARHGPGHWSTVRSLATYRRHCAERRVYVLTIPRAGQPIACWAVSPRHPGFAPKRVFTAPAAPAWWLTSLFVHPRFQRQGWGRTCLNAVRRLARAEDVSWVRFDAYVGPAGAGPFYRRCGCRCVGQVSVRGTPLDLYETPARPG